ncbi:TFIIB-type zinc ribbon-containing protein [Paenibacillus sp. FSL K6-1230]|uniref:TFIIB-type zinc ribbon-containing protein n=1 Tax=Paenibacillus sp. FSL K6-1230 TaxID=2921603 RepID=UPI0003A47AEA
MPVIDYKCPSCGGSMAFDSTKGMLACSSCGRTERIEDFPDPLKQSVFTDNEAREYHCNSCGADLMTDAETTATSCSFCGSPVVLADRLTGRRAPVKIIPFSISKEEAIAAFKKWCRNGLLTPRGFMTADRIKGITGIYVPYWLYDLDNDIEVQARGTKVRSYTRGDYRYTETSHYDIYRKIRLNYVDVPIDAAAKMDDHMMDKLEPFPLRELKSFKSPYLAGFIAESYSYDDGELLPRAKSKISSYIDSYIRNSMAGYATVTNVDRQIDTQLKNADYVLLPVWMVIYDYNRMEHAFAMNGQTGKVVGKPPLSKMKIATWFAGIAGATLLTLKIASFMMGGGFW